MAGVQEAMAKLERRRRTSLLLELLPFAAGVVTLVVVLLMYVCFSLPETNEEGKTWFGSWMDEGPRPLVYLALLVTASLSAVFAAAAVASFVSGIGWLNSGRVIAGFVTMGVRGFVSLGVLGAVEGGEGSELAGLFYFIVSISLAAGSWAALAYVTRRELRRYGSTSSTATASG